ncbi:unnamed protein product [Acanthoscelides obtectus]|uniref:Uncharacterized protein n=1 Tax=Acanthoscelides obtectus TaxID=200917 RepID=A0A9P0LL63_ACAOB|nr:unnamed protein product [Acanthoscelides obtectus]CAK1632215.1 hypothetical protein AOBTE_LOCUS7412 [Acanthoscelides obtectus]
MYMVRGAQKNLHRLDKGAFKLQTDLPVTSAEIFASPLAGEGSLWRPSGGRTSSLLTIGLMFSFLMLSGVSGLGDDKKEICYKNFEQGPFIVFVEAMEGTGIQVGQRRYLQLAKDLFQLNLTNIKRIQVKGRNRLGVEFLDYKSANSFANKELNGYNIYIPFNKVTCKGIIRQVDTSFPIEEIISAIESPMKVLDAKRLNRKTIVDGITKYTPTGTIPITFQGTVRPRDVSIYYLLFLVFTYIPPVTQFFFCLTYGHTKTHCKGKRRCFNCSNPEHNEEFEDFHCHRKCYHCDSLEHRSNSKDCPEYKRQEKIKQPMIFENISYFEANELCPETNQNTPSTSGTSQINIAQRRTFEFANTIKTKRTFQQALSQTPKKKERIVEQNTGYNRDSYNENLNRNGREQNRNIPITVQAQVHNNSSSTEAPFNTPKTPTSALHSNNTKEQVMKSLKT